MGDTLYIELYLTPFEVTETFLKKVNNIMKDSLCIYYEPRDGKSHNKISGYWSDLKGEWFYEKHLEEGIQVISQEGAGGLQYWVGDMAFIMSIHSKSKEDNGFGSLSFSIDQAYFHEWKDKSVDPRKNLESIIKINMNICRKLKPIYGYGELESHIITQGADMHYPNIRDIKANTVNSIYWLNFFGKEIVERYNKAKILNLKSWFAESINDSGILLLLSKDPLEYEIKLVENIKKFFEDSNNINGIIEK